MKNQKLVLLFLIVFLVFLFPLFSRVQAAGLVPCGGPKEPPCQLCHFFVLFDNIFRFLLFKIVPPLAILMIVIAGVMFMFAYFGGPETLPGGAKGGPTLLNQAKKLITSVIIGLIIVYAAWLIVNLFFQVIGVATWEGWSLSTDWWKINCPIK